MVTGVSVGRTAATATEVRCSTVVSSAGVRNTFGKLVPAGHRHRVAEPLASLGAGTTPSICHLTLFVALRGDRAALKLPAANYWISTSADHTKSTNEYYSGDVLEKPFPAVFLSFPSTKVRAFPLHQSKGLSFVSTKAWLVARIYRKLLPKRRRSC
eukprot:SAG11_NODE_1267_length_5342_cov_1.772459_5_plen_156_part_00